MPSSINASTTAGLVNTADTSGVLQLQTAGVTAISIDASQAVSFTNSPTVTGGTANGVAYLNGSKVLTTGSALVFDGSNLGLGGTNNSYGSQTAMTLSGTNVSRIDFRSNNTFTGTILSYQAVTEGLRLQTEAGYPITFYPAGTERARFDTGGSLLIATTTAPTTGGFPRSPLSIKQINDTGFASGIQLEANADQSVLGIGYNGTTFQLGTSYRGTGASKGISFSTGNVEAVRIDTSGNLLVGQASGSNKLSVTGTVYLDSRVGTGYGSAAAAWLGVFGSSNEDAVNSGAVYNMEWRISGNAGGQYWYSNYLTRGGSRTLGAYCTGTTWTNASDIVNKEDIVSIGYGLETVMASNPVDFRWKTMKDEDGLGKKDIGFIAQEMELIVPEVVTGEEGQKGISYGSLVAVAFKAIQEQQALITQLQADVAALKGA